MAANDLAGLTAIDAHRWLRGLQLWHAARFVVMAAVVAATIVSSVLEPGCTPEHPCGPSPQGTWWLALVLASLVLLIGAPGLGCLSGLALGVLGAGYDPAPSARGWWAAEAALSATALVLLLLIRVHQHRVAATIEGPINLPGGGTATSVTRDRQVDATHRPGDPLSWNDPRAMLIGVAAAAGIVLMIIYQYQVSVSAEHLRHAVQTDAVVQYVDTGDSTTVKYSVDLYLAEADQVLTVDLASEDDYQIGQVVPVMADTTGSEPWLRLIAQPDDQTAWLSFAILAWLLAAAATLRPVRVWWAHRRPADGDLRGILVSTRWPAADVDLGISAADGSGLRLSVLRSPVPARIPELAKEWTPPELGVVTGQLWYGGVVQLRALGGEVLADAIMGLPRRTLLRSWYASPTVSTIEDTVFAIVGDDESAVSRVPMVVDGDGPQGAAELTPFRAHGRHRLLLRWIFWCSAVLAVGTVGLVLTGVWRAQDKISGLAVVSVSFFLVLAPFSPHFVRAHVAVSGEGVIVVNSFSTYQIPWGAISAVELKPAVGPWREWSSTPDDDFQMAFNTTYGIIRAEVPIGPDLPGGRMAAIVNRIVDYRDRTRVTDGQPATAVKVTGTAAHSRRHRHWRGRP